MRLDILSSNLWSSAVHRCKDGLEPDDLCQVENCPNPQELRNALWLLQQDFDEQQSLLILSITHHPIIDLERICVSLTDGEGNALDSSVVWGMVLLLIKISTEADDRMPRVSKILRDLGFKLELFNGYMTEDTAIPQLREGVTDIMIYTLEFLQKIVKVFRDPLFST
ncbi:hypothetical protein F5B20DRAFT_415690 [Whalleya microplaca]|nr:hypothetical protein F5B20DRAFT_415690 [Whalleya microplaca]